MRKKIQLFNELVRGTKVTIVTDSGVEFDAVFSHTAIAPLRGIFQAELGTIDISTSELNEWYTVYKA